MESNVFSTEPLILAGTTERALRGGRHLFPLLPAAFDGIRRIGVIGWGPQGRAQAMNLRDSLHGTGIEVVVGLRPSSPSRADANACGFHEDDGSLADIDDVLATSQMVLLLIADGALVDEHQSFFRSLQPGATIGLSHGFLSEHLRRRGRDFPAGHSVVAVCPKGMGASVRRLYEQGACRDGAGINASVAVHRDIDGRAWDQALGWAVALGAPFVFETTLESELRSDIVGERAALLGGVHGIVEALYRRFAEVGDAPERAFLRSAECVTGALAPTISHGGVQAVLDAVDDAGGDARRSFDDAYCSTYAAVRPIVAELYDDVELGVELASVEQATRRLPDRPMPTIDGTRMWRVGADVRAKRAELACPLDPLTAGVFCGLLLAQVDELAARGHPWSEIANESVIEAVDSLIPYMHARGVAYMVDSCSTTARLGTRRWGPRFEAAVTQQVLPALDAHASRDERLLADLVAHPLHGVLAAIAAYRPSVDIAVA